jgi:hypothetical protein
MEEIKNDKQTQTIPVVKEIPVIKAGDEPKKKEDVTSSDTVSEVTAQIDQDALKKATDNATAWRK